MDMLQYSDRISDEDWDSDDEENNHHLTVLEFKQEVDIKDTLTFCAHNEVYLDLVEMLAVKVKKAIDCNQELQESIEKELQYKADKNNWQNSCSAFQALSPYFKDLFQMAPALNIEAEEIDQICDVDPLMIEERRWKNEELILLEDCVKQSLLFSTILPLHTRKDVLIQKLSSSGVETLIERKKEWRETIKAISRRITQRQSPVMFERESYENVDWAGISVTDFRNTRSICQLKMKWCNELSPEFSRDEWTEKEDISLAEHIGKKNIDWDAVASQLGTPRAAFQCFQRSISLRNHFAGRNPWSAEEDKKLLMLVRRNTVRGNTNWHNIASEMPGRNTSICELRYNRSLDEKLVHGRWTIDKDLLLWKAVDKFGPQAWGRVADFVGNRSNTACRDRWINVLDTGRRNMPWLWEEHARLLMGVKIFGRKNYAKIALILPGRNNLDVKNRISALIKFRIKTFEAEQDDRVYAGYRAISHNFIFLKQRRDEVVRQIKLEDPKADRALYARLELGSFVRTTPEDHVDAVSKRKKNTSFGKFVTKTGRWTKTRKNPNDYGSEELKVELNKLPERRKQVLLEFLERSDVRYAQELQEEKEEPAAELVSFYESMITRERMKDLKKAMDRVLKIEASDIYLHTRIRKQRLKGNARVVDLKNAKVEEDSKDDVKDPNITEEIPMQRKRKRKLRKTYDYSLLTGHS